MRDFGRIVFAGMLVFLVVFLSVSVFARDVGIERAVVVTGKAPGRGEDAKKEALHDAMRNAVERVAVKIYSETRTDNYVTVLDRIIARANGFVKGYKILTEKYVDGNTVLKVRVRVGTSSLKDQWGAIQTALETAGKPRLLIFIEDVIDRRLALRATTENALTEYLDKKGFPLVDGEQIKAVEKRELKAARAAGDYGRVARLGTQYKGEIALFGTADATYGGTVTIAGVTVHQYNAQLDVRVIRTDTAEILGQINQEGKASKMNRGAACKEALRDAAKKAGKVFVKRILKRFTDESFGGASLVLVINEIGFTDLNNVMRDLRKRKGVEDITQRHYRQRSVELEVKSKLTPRRLAESVEALANYKITVEEFTARRIVTKFRGKRAPKPTEVEVTIKKKTETKTIQPIPQKE